MSGPSVVRPAFEAGGDIYTVAENVTVFHDDIALVNPDMVFDALGRRETRAMVGHLPLNNDSTA